MTDRRLLATDLDGTFIGNDEAMLKLWDALRAREVIVAFSTGRHLQSIEHFYAQKHRDAKLPVTWRSQASICMVGTDIYFRTDGAYRLDRTWHDRIAERWDKQAVEAILNAIPEVRMQDAEWQSPFKSSYYLDENVEARLREIQEQLERASLRAKVVYSAGKFLDLLNQIRRFLR